MTGWRTGDGMEWLKNTERLTLKPERMKNTILQSAIYNISGRKARLVYNVSRGVAEHSVYS